MQGPGNEASASTDSRVALKTCLMLRGQGEKSESWLLLEIEPRVLADH